MKSNLATEMCKAKFRRPLSEESITTNLVSIFVASEMRGRMEMRSVIDPRIFTDPHRFILLWLKEYAPLGEFSDFRVKKLPELLGLRQRDKSTYLLLN